MKKALAAAAVLAFATSATASASPIRQFTDGVSARLTARGIPVQTYPVQIVPFDRVVIFYGKALGEEYDAVVADGRIQLWQSVASLAQSPKDTPELFRTIAAALIRAREQPTTDVWEYGVGRAAAEAVAIDEANSWALRYRIAHPTITPRRESVWVTRVRRWSITGGRSAWTRPGAVLWRRQLVNADYARRRAMIEAAVRGLDSRALARTVAP
jgi:hypothetical protein